MTVCYITKGREASWGIGCGWQVIMPCASCNNFREVGFFRGDKLLLVGAVTNIIPCTIL